MPIGVPVQGGQLGDAPVMAGLLRRGEEGRNGVEGHGGPHHAAPEAQDVRVVVLAGQGGRRHIVHHRRPDAGNLVGCHRDADPRPAGTDTQLSQAVGDRPPYGGTEVGIVHPQLGVVGTQVRDLVALPLELVLQDLLESEPRMVRAEGDAHEGSVYRAARERPGDPTHRGPAGPAGPPVPTGPSTRGHVQPDRSSGLLRPNKVRLRASIKSAAST